MKRVGGLSGVGEMQAPGVGPIAVSYAIDVMAGADSRHAQGSVVSASGLLDPFIGRSDVALIDESGLMLSIVVAETLSSSNEDRAQILVNTPLPGF